MNNCKLWLLVIAKKKNNNKRKEKAIKIINKYK